MTGKKGKMYVQDSLRRQGQHPGGKPEMISGDGNDFRLEALDASPERALPEILGREQGDSQLFGQQKQRPLPDALVRFGQDPRNLEAPLDQARKSLSANGINTGEKYPHRDNGVFTISRARRFYSS